MRRFCLAAAVLLLSVPPLAAEPVTVEGRGLELVPPVGYCFLDGSDPNQQQLVDQLVASNSGQNLVIGYAGACNEITAYSVGAVPYLQEYATFMVPLINGAFQAQPGTRADFLAGIAATLPAVDDAMLSQIESEFNKDGGQSLSGTQFLGLLHQDENAIYLGLIATWTAETSFVGVTVIAMTLVNEVPLSMNIYRPYRSNADIVALLVEATTAMQNLVAANP